MSVILSIKSNVKVFGESKSFQFHILLFGKFVEKIQINESLFAFVRIKLAEQFSPPIRGANKIQCSATG